MDAYAGRGPVYLPGYPYWLDARPCRCNCSGCRSATCSKFRPTSSAPPSRPRRPPFMLVLKPDDGERLAALRTRFPEGRLTPYADSAGRVMFTVFAAAPE
ncbi:MAG TPA: hypothetical protein VL049_14775 [Candidatus Dormibacteraeota bacterium]|nr:hypothetical protein [Candidatus Dormibacteraeota bacterium]